MIDRAQLNKTRRWVIKIGSALLTNEGRGLDLEAIDGWVREMAALHKDQGIELVLVSSGAVAEGMQRLGWTRRPAALYELQAAAAVGQMGLIQAYESCFQQYNMHTAQILLTHDDLSNRQRYLNARSTLVELLRLGVVPVVNENDTVLIDEIRFGDNDTLAGLIANLVEADLMVILTDQEGLHERDPRLHPDSGVILEAQAGDPELGEYAGGSTELGRGGMVTKLKAATLAARSGAATVIASGRRSGVLGDILRGETIGTLLVPGQEPLAARKQWLASHLQIRGRLVLDDGAVRVLRDSGRSLLAVGVKQVEGQFARGEMVACVDENGSEVARGLVNYNADESRRIMGNPSDRIAGILGYVDEPELIHRDNLVLV